MRPTVTFDAVGPVIRGHDAKFLANPSDPDGPSPTLSWIVDSGNCQLDAADPSTFTSTSISSENPYMVAGKDTENEFCVRARVVDQYGAATVAFRDVPPLSQPPVADFSIVPTTGTTLSSGAFPKHTMLKLTAQLVPNDNYDPLDTLKYEWSLKDAQGNPTSMIGACAVISPDTACVTADVAGDFELELDVSDHASPVNKTVVRKPLRIAAGAPPHADVVILSPDSPTVVPGAPTSDGLPTYPLGSTLKLSAEGSTPDANPTFTVTVAPGTKPTPIPCVGGLSDPYVQCLTLTDPGPYTVRVDVATDDGMDSKSISFRILDDQLPCIDDTNHPLSVPPTPIPILLASKPTAPDFSAGKTCDDLDSYPNTTFVPFNWFLINPNAPNPQPVLKATGQTTFSLDRSQFSVGQSVQVRLEIRDGNAARSAADLMSCAGDTCKSAVSLCGQPTCFQRYTWTVSFL